MSCREEQGSEACNESVAKGSTGSTDAGEGGIGRARGVQSEKGDHEACMQWESCQGRGVLAVRL